MLEVQSRVLVPAATSQLFRQSARRAGDLGHFQKVRIAALTEESAKDRAATWVVHTQRRLSRAPPQGVAPFPSAKILARRWYFLAEQCPHRLNLRKNYSAFSI